MFDKSTEKITGDRLGLKVQLFAKDSEQSLDILTRMQYEIGANICPQLISEHDPNLKGTIELEELMQIVKETIRDKDV